MVSCTRDIRFDAGHRLKDHEGKCSRIHGHGYLVEITATAEKLDDVGRIIDFGIIKDKIGSWIDANWDHGTIISSEDGDVIKAISSIPDSKLFILPCNPSAENIAKYLLEEICPTLLREFGVTVTKVVVHETPNCRAEASL